MGNLHIKRQRGVISLLSIFALFLSFAGSSDSLSVNQGSLVDVYSEKQSCPYICPDGDCDWWGNGLDCDHDDIDDDLEVGWIVAFIIVGVVILIGIPCLICFFCACCCFKSCRSKKPGQIVYVQGPPPHTGGAQQPSAPHAYPQPMEYNAYTDNQGYYAEPPPQYPHHPPLPNAPPPDTNITTGKY